MTNLILCVSLFLVLLIFRIALGDTTPKPKIEIGMDFALGKRELYADACDWAHYGDQTMCVVANGIGRNQKGKIAAQAAVETFVHLFEATGTSDNPTYFFGCALNAANSAILKKIVDSSAGASVICAVMDQHQLYYASVGNCRIAVYRNGDLIPLSEGQTINVLAKHAFRQRQINRMDALAVLNEKRVYSFVGHDGFKGMELFDVPVTLKKDDIIVLTSDGVHDFCTTKQLEDIIKANNSCTKMAFAVTDMLRQADHPEQDNASVVFVKVNKV